MVNKLKNAAINPQFPTSDWRYSQTRPLETSLAVLSNRMGASDRSLFPLGRPVVNWHSSNIDNQYILQLAGGAQGCWYPVLNEWRRWWSSGGWTRASGSERGHSEPHTSSRLTDRSKNRRPEKNKRAAQRRRAKPVAEVRLLSVEKKNGPYVLNWHEAAGRNYN